MRILALAAIGAMSCSAVVAAECGRGSADALEVVSWSAAESTNSFAAGVEVTVEVRNNLPQGVRMWDASVRFYDVLGRSIGSIGVAPDLRIAAGDTAQDGGSYLGSDLDRLLSMDAADVVVLACTRAVVMNDGTAQRFDD